MSHEMNKRERSLAHACDLTVITETDPCLPGCLAGLRTAADVAFSAHHHHFDTLSVFDLAEVLKDPARLSVLVTDVRTAVGLHSAEKVLVCSNRTAISAAVTGALKEVPEFSHLQIKANPLPMSYKLKRLPLVVTCMDWRLHGEDALCRLIQEHYGITDFRLMTTAGVAKELASATPRQEMIGSQFWGLKRHDLVSNVIVLNHEDCGKYGGSKQFRSMTAEHACYSQDLVATKRWLAQRLPGVKVQVGIIALEDQHHPVNIIPT